VEILPRQRTGYCIHRFPETSWAFLLNGILQQLLQRLQQLNHVRRIHCDLCFICNEKQRPIYLGYNIRWKQLGIAIDLPASKEKPRYIHKGVSSQLLQKLQVVQNPAARLVTGARICEHMTPVLRELHWLQRITLKTAVLAYKCQHGAAPQSLQSYLSRRQCALAVVTCVLHRWDSWSFLNEDEIRRL